MKVTRTISRSIAASLGLALALSACEADLAGPLEPGSASSARIATAVSGGTVVVVSPANMRGWLFYQDSGDFVDNSLGSFVTGPGSPPYGEGSVEISTSGSSRPNLATFQFAGTPLADITNLAFATYNPSAGNGGSLNRSGYLQFNVDFDASDTWQRRLVFVPNQNGTVLQDAWQVWDAIDGGDALWGYSGGTWPVTGGTGLKTWTQILADYPAVRIRATDAFLGVRVGEPYVNGYTENIDALTFGTAAGTTVFDFERYEVVVAEKQCKDGGWQTSFRADLTTFSNQGECVRYAITGK